MNFLHIFKSGTHTDMNGKQFPFSPADLQACAQAYDPSLHEAPIVIGHPKDNSPAYGWVKSLTASGNDLIAEPQQIDAQFAELVDTGRYKKISASFYLPDSPNNPKPGVLYLRHVGFLGAQPPAIKGLKQVEFSEQEQGVVAFSDWSEITNASLWGRLREFLISKFGMDEADRALPSWQVDSLREEAYSTTQPEPAFHEFNNIHQREENTVTNEEKKALEDENARLKEQLAARDAAESQRKQAEQHTGNVAFAEKLVADGKLAPVAQPVVVALLNAVTHGESPVEFAEGDVKKPLATVFKDLLSSAQPVIDFGEHATKDRVDQHASTDTTEFADADPERLALHQKARALAKKEGISYDAAVARCL
ncbi:MULTISPECIES: peptidase [Xenorhabdus]|uniref:peptidase n=1 Tax=Xenorhabdus TaxID=626 RepID=UPI00064B6615|nr:MULTISPECIES: peptidase [Xenorhabdus]KLU14282.1 peptidase [Xenorhabdus griffiniae]KOP35023.1 peptidase [Xenorhabdus sp. GDc328]